MLMMGSGEGFSPTFAPWTVPALSSLVQGGGKNEELGCGNSLLLMNLLGGRDVLGWWESMMAWCKSERIRCVCYPIGQFHLFGSFSPLIDDENCQVRSNVD